MFTENLNFLIAFAAGFLTFLSPCILPIIPSYLSFIGGISYDELADSRVSKWGIFIKTLFFVTGFSLVFVLLGVVFSSAGTALSGISRIVNMVAGSVIIVLGLNCIFDFWKILNMDTRFHIEKRPGGIFGPALLGMAFGAGWTPCVGPILASILFLAGSSGKVLAGTFLLAAYSAGLGVPFILAGFFFSTFQKQMAKIRPHLQTIKIVSGIFLIVLGILIFVGSLSRMNAFMFTIAGDFQEWSEANPLGPRLLFGSLFLVLSLLFVVFYLRRVFRIIHGKESNKKSLFLPVRLLFIIILTVASVLSYTGVLDISRMFTHWLTFQGI